MIISDLSYLEVVSESSVVGGTKKPHEKHKKDVLKKSSFALASNVNVTKQNATAIAYSKYGPATAVAINTNVTVQTATAIAK